MKCKLEMQLSSLFKIKPSHNSEKDVNQILTVFGASICGVMMGAMLSWPSPAIPKLLEPEYGITIEEASYLTVIDAIAMIIGNPIFAKLADKIGRKRTMFVVPITFIICYLLTTLSSYIYVLYISRIFAGLGYAAHFSCAPTYIGEVTTPKVRSKYGHVLMTLGFVGQLISNLVGLYCDIVTMAYMLLLVAIIGTIIIYFLPESPYYYVMKNNLLKARTSLEILRRTKNVDEELNDLTAAVQRQLSESTSFKELFIVPSNRNALVICNVVRALQQLSGISVFTSFIQYIFQEAGTQLSSGYGAMIISGMLIIANIFSNIVLDKVGKRLGMVYSCAGVFIALFGETSFFFLKEYTKIDISAVSWFPVLGLTMYVIFFCMGQSNVPTLLLGELFPSNIKPHGVTFMNIVYAIYVASTNKLFQYFASTFGLCVPFSMFTISAFIGIFVSYYIIPETKGKTLEEIQMMLRGVKSGPVTTTNRQ